MILFLISRQIIIYFQIEQIADKYNEEFQNIISTLVRTELILFLLTFLVFGFIIIFIFRPKAKTLKNTFIDINERNESMLMFFYAMKEALFLVEKSGVIINMNMGAREMLNSEVVEYKKENILTALKWIDVDIIAIIEKCILGKELDGIEVKIEDKNGSVINMIISTIKGKYNGKEVVLISAFDITAQKNAEKMLEDMAIKDELTGLYNRHFLESIIDLEIERAKRYEFPLSASILDIDDFKKINDKWGHPVGDLILKEIANILKANLRESDYLIRIGGEEFVIIMSHTDLEGAYIVTDKLRRAIEKSEHPIVGQFTVSFGVAEIEKEETYAELYERMDQALYKAKKSGKNKVVKSISEDDITWDKIFTLERFLGQRGR